MYFTEAPTALSMLHRDVADLVKQLTRKYQERNINSTSNKSRRFSHACDLYTIEEEEEVKCEVDMLMVNVKSIVNHLNMQALRTSKEGQWAEALEVWRDVLQLHCSSQPSATINGEDIASTLNNIGIALFWTGNVQVGIEAIREGLVMRQNILGVNHLDCSVSHHNMANFFMFLRDYDSALCHYFEELRIMQILGLNPVQQATVLNLIGIAYFKKFQVFEAKKSFDKALEIYKSFSTEKEDNTRDIVNVAGNIKKCEKILLDLSQRMPRIA